MIAFGPVPSRRLGRSLGINNIPPKICSYSCVYCQVGRTRNLEVGRRAFHGHEEIAGAVRAKVSRALEAGESVDYLTFVPDGEPTLDMNLGRHIESLKPLGLPIAVITNASLIWRKDVRADLMLADWVSLKLDAVGQATWQHVNRPHGSLELDAVLQGALRFAGEYGGELVTETMLVRRVNDSEEHLEALAGFLSQLPPHRAYLSVPTRPPAESWAQVPGEDVVNRAYHILSKATVQAELLIGYEGNEFALTGHIQEDMLSITAVHPMRRDAVQACLDRAGASWEIVRRMLAQDLLVEVEYGGHQFYLRRLGRDAEEKEPGLA